MPMEHIRRRFAEDPHLYPELNGSKTQGGLAQPISIASTSKNSSMSSGPSAPPRKPTQKAARLMKRATVILSSDEEGDEPETVSDSDDSDDSIQIIERPAGNNNHKSPIHARVKNIFETTPAPSSKPPSDTSLQPIPITPAPARFPITPAPSKFPATPAMQRPIPNPSGGTPIAIPFNRTPALPPPAQKVHSELVHSLGPPIPGFRNVEEDRYVPPAQVEKELRDLMSGGMNTDLENHVEIDMSQSKVEGFAEGIELLPHQILGRAWMKDREDVTKKAHGGILADDMGLGKTIQTLTRMVEGRARKSDRDDGWSAATLVICPLALVGQWADEIQKMTKLKVIKHQGPNRTTDPRVWSNYHVVVTTYDTVRNEYESFTPSSKDESKASSSKAKKNDDDDSDSEAENFGRTLAKKTVKKGNKKNALFHVKWFRIVLDEAHNIKNHKTKGAIACCELEAKFRWALTGTPMQNNVTELFSLLKFLRTKPLSQWDTFNEQIAKPVNSGRGAVRAMKRLQVVLQKIMLRRRKDQSLNGKALIQLPKRTVEIISCPFDPSERNFYTALETKMEDVIEKLMATTNKNYMSMLLLLLRLRQACNHPILVAKDYKQDTDAVEPRAVTKGKDDLDADADDLIAAFGQLGVTKKCQLCMTVLSSSNTAEAPWQTHCVDCASLAEEAKMSESDRPSSAKIRMVLKLLKDIDDRSQCEEKTIIFSQFTSMLDLIEPFLQDKGVKYVRYDGSMLPKEREAALDKIKTSNSTRVILISFKAGSTGLNLTACNNVILVDLWWNPALEDQAFDRAHRFGQKRDVNIFKLKIDNTVEDRILDLQDKKRILAAAALSGDRIKDMRLGMEDLLALFRPGGRDDEDEDEDED